MPQQRRDIVIRIHAFAADPHGTYVAELIARISALDTRHLVEIGVGSLVYAGEFLVEFLVEGIGLLLRKMRSPLASSGR